MNLIVRSIEFVVAAVLLMFFMMVAFSVTMNLIPA